MPKAKKDIREKRKEEIIKVACKLFAEKGYYNTTIPDIAEAMGMSVGNLYNYFKSKEELAKFIMQYSSRLLGEEIKKINEQDITTKEKVYRIVRKFFEISEERPELIEYFLRVFLANREVFQEGCEGFLCVSEVVTELMIFLEEGAKKGDLRQQDFFPAFVTLMGPLGGMVFLKGEDILPKKPIEYSDELAENIWRALKT
ncbi:MAG TPA: TetR/AcrR family transcriptional regulator [Persephonella sp.]|uniref:Transcriptional regulator, TetR family n=1 Tax=Persephonella marina (strain DSM 14350 / EX-H1) TaxID=123214 RepID=C0QPV7_PERMH|nr:MULTISPECIES: TetR/AcrR family transcriptional regulator [Persephonella]ACO03422.1 transcriptional regulator, TetR family [Persephonella marina EX-H1]HCB69682.1 TetR/AcrR family transcriptional regulator [Persephonella sp.]